MDISKTKVTHMKTILLLFLCITTLCLTSCATVQVSQDFDNTYNFNNAHTYNWNKKAQEATTGLLQEDELLANRFFTAIDRSLTDHGFTLSDKPDFLVSCNYTITSRLQADSVQPTIGFGYGRYGRYGGVGIQSGTSVRQYDRALLIINIHDTNDGKLIWKGNGTREVFTHNSPEKLTKSVNEMVQSTLMQFPPSK
ncbi:MAG: hypothetical protein ACI8PB_002712 [Desulforhopalus sp.]|jgi:hypothetical protein